MSDDQLTTSGAFSGVEDETTGQSLRADYFNDLDLILSMSNSMRVGHGLSMRIELVNRGRNTLRGVKLEFRSEDGSLLKGAQPGPVSVKRPALHQLCAGETCSRLIPVQIDPQQPGERQLLIYAELGDCGDGQPRALESYIVLNIEESMSGGDRHYHINVQGPQVNVSRSNEGSSEGNRAVGNDDRVISDNRPEIHINEAAFQAHGGDAKSLIQFRVPMWLDWDRTVELL